MANHQSLPHHGKPPPALSLMLQEFTEKNLRRPRSPGKISGTRLLFGLSNLRKRASYIVRIDTRPMLVLAMVFGTAAARAAVATLPCDNPNFGLSPYVWKSTGTGAEADRKRTRLNS